MGSLLSRLENTSILMANPSSIKESYMENYSPINISYIVQIGNDGADDVLWALTAWQMPVHIEELLMKLLAQINLKVILNRSLLRHRDLLLYRLYLRSTSIQKLVFNFIPVGSHVFNQENTPLPSSLVLP